MSGFGLVRLLKFKSHTLSLASALMAWMRQVGGMSRKVEQAQCGWWRN